MRKRIKWVALAVVLLGVAGGVVLFRSLDGIIRGLEDRRRWLASHGAHHDRTLAGQPGSGHRAARNDPLGGLSGDCCDAVVVLVVVPDPHPGRLSGGGDQEIVDSDAAVM